MSTDGVRKMYKLLKGEELEMLQRMLDEAGIDITSNDERILLRAILENTFPWCPGVINHLFRRPSHGKREGKRKAGEAGVDEVVAVCAASCATSADAAAAADNAVTAEAVAEVIHYEEMSSWASSRQAAASAWRIDSNAARHASIADAVHAVGAEDEHTAAALCAVDKVTAASMGIEPGRAEEIERDADNQHDALVDLQAGFWLLTMPLRLTILTTHIHTRLPYSPLPRYFRKC
jgi:hypothetical protein